MSTPSRKPVPVAFPEPSISSAAPILTPKLSQDSHQSEWDRIAAKQEFIDLMATKKMFIVPAFVFFVVYYFLLPVLVGYAPALMSTKVLGPVNLAYLFALSQFFMAWTIAFLYVKAANGFDKLAKDIIDKLSQDTAAKLANSRGGN